MYFFMHSYLDYIVCDFENCPFFKRVTCKNYICVSKIGPSCFLLLHFEMQMVRFGVASFIFVTNTKPIFFFITECFYY